MKKSTLLYDANCPLCRWARDWLMKHMYDNAFECVPCGSEKAAGLLPPSMQHLCDSAMVLVTNEGNIYTGAASFSYLAAGLRGWGWAAPVFALPGIRHIMALLYLLVSRHRYGFSRLLGVKNCTCDAPGAKGKSSESD